MKKYFRFGASMLSVLGLMVSMSSCDKCQTCTYDGESEELCEEDFDSKEQYDSYISLVEAFGAKCK